MHKKKKSPYQRYNSRPPGEVDDLVCERRCATGGGGDSEAGADPAGGDLTQENHLLPHFLHLIARREAASGGPGVSVCARGRTDRHKENDEIYKEKGNRHKEKGERQTDIRKRKTDKRGSRQTDIRKRVRDRQTRNRAID